MKGYVINAGYMGHVPLIGYVLFATENEYCEYYNAHKGEWEELRA